MIFRLHRALHLLTYITRMPPITSSCLICVQLRSHASLLVMHVMQPSACICECEHTVVLLRLTAQVHSGTNTRYLLVARSTGVTASHFGCSSAANPGRCDNARRLLGNCHVRRPTFDGWTCVRQRPIVPAGTLSMLFIWFCVLHAGTQQALWSLSLPFATSNLQSMAEVPADHLDYR